ncbi:DUF5301 domain-containing protein [Catenibacterium mitsuokai]|uniref:DUF5301 domain-containing protein n=1 Tax=Catenibacterium mitsuokai TaxID=100886 RepID=UPI00319E4D9F
MKKIGLVVIIIMLGIYTFHSNKKTLDLPDTSKVEFEHVHDGDMTTAYECDESKISSLIKNIEEKSSYSKESVNDNPNNVDYIKVKMDTKTYYVYERNEKTYIEEPYNGIWKISSDLYKTIKNNKDKLIVKYED